MIEIEFATALNPIKTWERLTQNDHLRRWWDAGVALEPAKKGKLTVPWKDETGQPRVTVGLITSFDPPKRLQLNYQQHNWPRPTRIEFLLSPYNDGTQVSFQHSGWETIADEVERRHAFDAHSKLWATRIDNFTKYCAEVK